MLVKALKATLALPARIVVLPFRLSMLSFNKVIRKKSETAKAEVRSPLKTILRHPLHSTWLSRSALMVAMRPGWFAFDDASFVSSGQVGLFGELSQGSWKPFHTKVYNTKMVGRKRSSRDQDNLKETNVNRSNTLQQSNCLQDLPLKRFPPSSVGAVVLNHHPSACFIPLKRARFQYLNFNFERIRPAPRVIIKTWTSQLNSAVSVKDNCGCKMAEFLSREWCKLLVLIVILTRVAHLLVHAARSKHLLLFASMTSFISTQNDLIDLPNPKFTGATPSVRPKEETENCTVPAHESCTDSDQAKLISGENYEVSQISSNPRKQDGTSKNAPEEADKARCLQVDQKTPISGRKRKRGKRGKGKRKSGSNDAGESTACDLGRTENSHVESGLNQVSKRNCCGQSTIAKRNLKEIGNSDNHNLKDSRRSCSQVSRSRQTGTTTSEETTAHKNINGDKRKGEPKSRSGRKNFVSQANGFSKIDKSDERTSYGLESGSTEVAGTLHARRAPAVQSLPSNTSSKPAVSECFSGSKNDSGFSDLLDPLHTNRTTAKSDLNEGAESEYPTNVDLTTMSPDTSKRGLIGNGTAAENIDEPDVKQGGGKRKRGRRGRNKNGRNKDFNSMRNINEAGAP